MAIGILLEAAIKAVAVYSFLPPWLLMGFELAFVFFVQHWTTQKSQYPTTDL